ncbi:MAG: hypothetical protein LAQ69_05725 [Acidobacteriia bacterium]|nr:hypothetical protein [Terriglobia bacterium]
MKLARLVVLLSAASGWHLAAQTPTWDTSGNGLLKGQYYFRELAYAIADNQADPQDAVALYGVITFSGSGTYTMTVTVLDAASGGQAGSTSGTYSISASGYGFISHPVFTGVNIFGLVSSQQGVFVGSSTESGFNDLFIAAPVSSNAAANAAFKGSYWIADMDFSLGLSQGSVYTIGSQFQMNPDGGGNLGNVTLSGYLGGGGSTVYAQTAQNVKYAFVNGAATIAFPTSSSSTLIAGQKFLYISPDGNFVFGGSPNSFDMFVGVRVGSGVPNLGGLYYQAGIEEDFSALAATGYTYLETYFGSLNANGGTIVGHQRRQDTLFPNATDFTYSDAYTVKSDGTYSTPAMRYVVGAGGTRIGSGIGPFLGLNVALPAPTLSGDGVFLNPVGVVNAASSAPFTAGIAPGELLTLYGTNLSADTQIASVVPFPTTLAGVQVTFNGIAAPIYYATPGAISAIVPYGVTTSIAQIQVINNNVPSNTVTAFTALTAPGIFTSSQTGLGAGAVLHSDYSLVTAAHPALVGETVAVFLTGLGAVTPTIPDGSAGPISTYSLASNTITAFVGGVKASVGYAGLAPGLAGLYQVNLTIPTGLTAGNSALDISGPDSYTSEAVIPVATGSSSASPALAPAPQSVASRMRNSATPIHRPGSARVPQPKP